MEEKETQKKIYDLITFANIEDTAVFVGKGQIFEIWQPELFKKYSDICGFFNFLCSLV